jgi:fatty aldehyde-generating acyl-ACP reductase
VESTVSIQLGVSLPVVVDFQGRLARGVTQDIGLDTISFVTDCVSSQGTPVTVVLHFGHNVAYMPLSGHVSAVTEVDGDSPTQFRINITLSPLNHTERRILESAFQELDTYLRSLEMPESPARASARATLVTANPRSVLSLFITDNPYQLPYRSTVVTDKESRGLAQPLGSPPVRQAEQRTEEPVPTLSPPKLPPTRLSLGVVWQGVGLFVQVCRDLIVRFLPGPYARLLTTPITFAFIGHPRTLSDVPRKFPFASLLPLRVVERWFRYQWPFVASYITGLTLANGTPTTGAMLISPLTTEQMIRNPRLGRQRVLQTIRLAEKMGAKIAGLGAFTSIITRDGQELKGKVNLGLTTGNPQSAAIAVQNVLHAAALTNLSLPHATVAIVGGAGSVGSACAKMLARFVAVLFIIDIKKDELQNLITELADQPAAVKGMTNLDHVREADVVIATTNNPYILLTAHHLKAGAIVIDAAQPKNVSEDVPHQRPDVLVIDSAVVRTPDVDVHFNLDLGPNEALGCLSEAMILTAIGWDGHYSLGKADPSHATHIIATGRSLGFRLAPFRNSAGYVTEEDLYRVARARIKM